MGKLRPPSLRHLEDAVGALLCLLSLALAPSLCCSHVPGEFRICPGANRQLDCPQLDDKCPVLLNV